jgi:hypothetical protein
MKGNNINYGRFIVEFTGLEDCAEGLGNPRLVPVSSGWASLTWGVIRRPYHITSGSILHIFGRYRG